MKTNQDTAPLTSHPSSLSFIERFISFGIIGLAFHFYMFWLMTHNEKHLFIEQQITQSAFIKKHYGEVKSVKLRLWGEEFHLSPTHTYAVMNVETKEGRQVIVKVDVTEKRGLFELSKVSINDLDIDLNKE